MNIQIIEMDAILEKYPEQKPICLNYKEIRDELIALSSENSRLQKRIGYLEAGIDHDDCEGASMAPGCRYEIK